MPVVGFLSPGLPEPSSFLVAALREGLKEASYVEGKNVTIDVYTDGSILYEFSHSQGQITSLLGKVARSRTSGVRAREP
jgi:hypothetical protein